MAEEIVSVGLWQIRLSEIDGITEVYKSPSPGRMRYEIMVDGGIIIRDVAVEPEPDAIFKERDNLYQKWASSVVAENNPVK